ncbi:BQ2448_4720 [Microbotryum intermedium]|uniref:N-alpha-acetyltransferase 60 n=1 Tax=Microbotryum intermedium TaxID=269621 RepID=A0A238FLR6_9BASI|nr:BQ2448_4720 [Microbotryum intermedium]
MLLEPSYLPLNIGPSLTTYPTTSYYYPSDSSSSPSSLEPSSSCSIEALVRTGIRPFPVRRVTSTTGRLKVVSKAPAKSIELESMRTSDLEGVKALHDSNLPLVYPASFYPHLMISTSLVCLVARPSSPTTPAAWALANPSPFPTSSLTAACSPVGCISAQFFEPFRTPALLSIPTIQILSLVVDTSSRRTGLARRLFKALLDQVREMPTNTAASSWDRVNVKLHILERNEAAMTLYRDLGLVEIARCKRYYQRLGEDAIEMGGVVRL